MSPNRKLPHWTSIPIMLALTLAPAVALATDVMITATASGAAIIPWSGTISGQIVVTGFSDDGTTKTWLSDGQLTADPPISADDWTPAAIEGLWKWIIIKCVADNACLPHDPEHPTLLQSLTGNNVSVSLAATNLDYGIEVGCEVMNESGDPASCGGALGLRIERPFPPCDGHYVLSCSVLPDGPGSAVLIGEVAMLGGDQTIMQLSLRGRYTFDPSLELGARYIVTEEAWFDISGEDPQVLTVHETHSERPDQSTPVSPTTWGFVKALYR